MDEVDALVEDIRECARGVTRELGLLRAEDSELTLTRGHFLVELDKLGTADIKQLAEVLRVDQSTMSRTTRRLKSLGWVKVVANRDDRRRRPITLTRLGRKKLNAMNRDVNAQIARALNDLGREQRIAVRDGLRLYWQALKRTRIEHGSGGENAEG